MCRLLARLTLRIMANDVVVGTYRVQAEVVDEFTRLLRLHSALLQDLELTSGDVAVVYRSVATPPTFVEIFSWADRGAADAAHKHPDVIALWAQIDRLVEDRDGRPRSEFEPFERVVMDK